MLEKTIEKGMHKIKTISCPGECLSFVCGNRADSFFSFLKQNPSNVLFGEKPIERKKLASFSFRMGILFCSNCKKRGKDISFSELDYYLYKKSLPKRTINKIRSLYCGLSSISEPFLIDLSKLKYEEAFRIADMISSFFGDDKGIIVMPSLSAYGCDILALSFEQLLIPSKETPTRQEALNSAFDEFILDLDSSPAKKPHQTEKKQEGNTEASKGKPAETKIPSKCHVEEANDRKPNPVISFFRKLFAFDEVAKVALSNLAFSVVFLALSVSTSFLYFSFPSTENPSFFVICLIMTCLFLVMTIVPISFSFFDREKLKEEPGTHINYVVLEMVITIVIDVIAALIFISVASKNGWDSAKYWPFAITLFAYPVATILFVLVLNVAKKVKMHGRKK